jgi:uncharacterized protein YoxC
MPKVISTIIEDQVTFLTDVNVEYVSLVRHGANRTPFRILKNDKGGSTMEKVVTAVLIPKSLSEEAAAGHLNGYRSDEVKEYDTYKSFIQVDQETIDPDTAEVVFIDKKAGVLGVVASLVTEKEEGGDTLKAKEVEGKEATEDLNGEEVADAKSEADPVVIEKDALDYATMDELYMELYAMADIVGGSLRQSQIDPNSRKTTVLSAIDNFRTFASMVLDNAKSDDAVKAENHPSLSHHLPPAQKSETNDLNKDNEDAEKDEGDVVHKAACVCPSCGITVEAVDCAAAECPDCKVPLVSKEEKSEEPKAVEFDETAFMEKVMEKVTELLSTKVSTEDLETKVKEISEATTKTQTTLEDIGKKLDALTSLSETVTGLSESVEKLENTPIAAKSDVDEEDLDMSKSDSSAFAGTIFSNFRA